MLKCLCEVNSETDSGVEVTSYSERSVMCAWRMCSRWSCATHLHREMQNMQI